MLCPTCMLGSCTPACWSDLLEIYMMKIVKTNCMRCHVGILNDVVTAKGWSTIVDPMVCETKRLVYVECAHAAACVLQAAVKPLLLLLSGSWVAELGVQLVVGVVVESLWRHTWWICLLGCRLCEFWWFSRCRVRSAVVWTDVWCQCVLPFLMIRFLSPYSFRLKNLCGSWCSPCWPWVAPSEGFWCAKLLLLPC